MPDAARYALHRPEIREALDRGEAALFFERLRPAQIPLAVLSLAALLAYRWAA